MSVGMNGRSGEEVGVGSHCRGSEVSRFHLPITSGAYLRSRYIIFMYAKRWVHMIGHFRHAFAKCMWGNCQICGVPSVVKYVSKAVQNGSSDRL
jgi:hypothetical protein